MKKYRFRCPVCGAEYELYEHTCFVCPNCGFKSCDEWEIDEIEVENDGE